MNKQELHDLYIEYFSLGYLGDDMSSKFALISLLGYLKTKFPKASYSQLIKKISPELPDKYITGLEILCEDFSYGCKNFITFGLKDREVPNKIKEILSKYLPF